LTDQDNINDNVSLIEKHGLPKKSTAYYEKDIDSPRYNMDYEGLKNKLLQHLSK